MLCGASADGDAHASLRRAGGAEVRSIRAGRTMPEGNPAHGFGGLSSIAIPPGRLAGRR